MVSELLDAQGMAANDFEDKVGSEEDVQEFSLEPGDLAVVVREDGGTEVYVTFKEEETEVESNANMKAQYIVDFITFALGYQDCLDLFARTRLT